MFCTCMHLNELNFFIRRPNLFVTGPDLSTTVVYNMIYEFAVLFSLLPAGVIDDRGKFISITPEELNAVAQFIRQRGRVSITELAQASSSLINLTPDSRSTA